MQPKGLICAGGEATRLGELTRVANKHLLPVGRWPMIYYPLQLLQRAGITDVLLITGKGHAGQMIDLLGDGRLAARAGGEQILELDLTYKVQTEPGGIAQVVGMARDFVGDAPLVVVLGDNIFEFSQAQAISDWGKEPEGAQIFVKDVPDPENFGVVVYGDDGKVADIVEKAGVVDTRYPEPRWWQGRFARACGRHPLQRLVGLVRRALLAPHEGADAKRGSPVGGRPEVR